MASWPGSGRSAARPEAARVCGYIPRLRPVAALAVRELQPHPQSAHWRQTGILRTGPVTELNTQQAESPAHFATEWTLSRRIGTQAGT